jgi:hypothetical protein
MITNYGGFFESNFNLSTFSINVIKKFISLKSRHAMRVPVEHMHVPRYVSMSIHILFLDNLPILG